MDDCYLSILSSFITILPLLVFIQSPPLPYDFLLTFIPLFQVYHLGLTTFFPQTHQIPPQSFHPNQLLSLDSLLLSCSPSL